MAAWYLFKRGNDKKCKEFVIQFYVTTGQLRRYTLYSDIIAKVKNSPIFLRKTFKCTTAILHAQKQPRLRAGSLYLKSLYKSVSNGLNRIAFCHDLLQISCLSFMACLSFHRICDTKHMIKGLRRKENYFKAVVYGSLYLFCCHDIF